MADRTLSTAEQRRLAVVDSAITVFAEGGLLGTPVSRVAAHAGISPAYVFKLFPSKEELFIAALDACYDQVLDALSVGAEQADQDDPDAVLRAMGGAYADLLANRELLKIQVHALSAADVDDVAEAVRRGVRRVVEQARQLSGADERSVQRFVATGQLCHLVASLGLDDVDDPWARTLAAGIRHPVPATGHVAGST